MDPLSFTASLLAVIGSAVTVAKNIDQLRRSLRDASEEFCQLLNELSDLQVVLRAINLECTDHYTVPSEWHGMFIRSKNKLIELDALIQRCLRGNCDEGRRAKVLKLRWLKEKEKIMRIRDDLRETRQNLAIALEASNSTSISHLYLQIQRLSYETAQTNHRGASTGDAILEQMSHHTMQLQELNLQHLHLQNMVQDMQVAFTELPRPEHGEAVYAANCNRTRSAPNGFERVRNGKKDHTLHVEATYTQERCRPWCSCICHAKQNVRSPPSWKRIMGSLFIGYCGVPIISRPCNEFHCKQRSVFRVTVNYEFPQWLWTRVLLVSFLATTAGGPELILRIPRMIPWRSQTYQSTVLGDTLALRKMLESGGASAYDVDPDGVSLINNAIRYGHLSTCQLLIEYGCGVHREDMSGLCAFDNAWNKILSEPEGNSCTKQRLIELFPQDNEILDDRQFNLLHKIVLGFLQRDLGTALDDSTAMINKADSFGKTALWWAARRADHRSIATFLSYGADFRLADIEDQQPLHAAAWAGSVECLTLLLEWGADPNSRDAYGVTPLKIVASCVNDIRCLEVLVHHGGEINVRCNAGVTPISIATTNVMMKAAQCLVDLGADINIADSDGWNCLQLNIYWNEHESVRFCLQCEADYLNVTEEGYTTLHIAAIHGDIGTLEILTTSRLAGLDVEAKDKADKTARDHTIERVDVSAEWISAFEALLGSVKKPDHDSEGFGDSDSSSDVFEDASEMPEDS